MAAASATLPMLLTGVDDAYQRLSQRLMGLSQAEYLWEPTDNAWTVRLVDGRWIADWADPDPDPAPITTIAWRTWHIGLQCLASYVSPSLGDWPLSVDGRRWFGEVDAGQAALATSYDVFRARIVGLGEEGMGRQLGPAWGPYAGSTWADLVIHALDELSHHGAEIALLRDLYPHLAGAGT